jgi:hypothetical protein
LNISRTSTALDHLRDVLGEANLFVSNFEILEHTQIIDLLRYIILKSTIMDLKTKLVAMVKLYTN